MDEKLCYSPVELQAALGLSRSTVYALLHRADFPAVKIGRRIVVPVESLRAWLEKQSAGEGSGLVG